MSQSKIVATGEQKFVIQSEFTDMFHMRNNESFSTPIRYRYNIPWKIRVLRENGVYKVFLDCMMKKANWYIEAQIKGRTLITSNNPSHYWPMTFNERKPSYFFNSYSELQSLALPTFSVEFTVIIEKCGDLYNAPIFPPRSFENDLAKEDSDVTLIVKDKKFHVLKKYLATHSSYFKSLFSGNFSESEKSEIELKDIDPHDFQAYLEFIYAESLIEADTVLGILHLADFFDSTTAVKRCQEFLIYKSQLPLKQKFETAIKYNLEELKTKCMSEIKTSADLESIIPEKGGEYDGEIWKELFIKSLSLIP